MPQRKEIKWAQLRVGVMVAAGLIVFAIAIFFISGQIGFITRKYTLHAYFATAAGLRPGSQVEVAGVPAGTIRAVRLSTDRDPRRAVEIVIQIARAFQGDIRADSVANQTTAGLLGESYLDISRGSPDQPLLPGGGVLKSHQEADIKNVEQNANDVVSNLRVLSASLNNITDQITHAKGSIGKLLYDETLYNRMNATAGSAETVMNNIQQGQGTIGKFVVDPTVYNKTTATLDRLNQFLDQVQSGQGTLGRLISDPSVYNEVKSAASKANTLLDNVNQGQGTLGKLVKDPQLYDRLNSSAEHFDVIAERMEKGTGTLGKLSTDPSLFNNLSASSQSLKEFLTEFRQNPKKYLTLHLHVF